MESFNDTLGDLSEYKILSFEDVNKSFVGNISPLKGIANKSFEEMSNEIIAKSIFGKGSIFNETQKENFELTKKHRITNGISKK